MQMCKSWDQHASIVDNEGTRQGSARTSERKCPVLCVLSMATTKLTVPAVRSSPHTKRNKHIISSSLAALYHKHNHFSLACRDVFSKNASASADISQTILRSISSTSCTVRIQAILHFATTPIIDMMPRFISLSRMNL